MQNLCSSNIHIKCDPIYFFNACDSKDFYEFPNMYFSFTHPFIDYTMPLGIWYTLIYIYIRYDIYFNLTESTQSII